MDDLVLAGSRLGLARADKAAAVDEEAFDEAEAREFAAVSDIESAYDAYVAQYEAADQAVGDYLASLWIPWAWANELGNRVNKLPSTIGSIQASREQIEAMFAGASSFNANAGVYIDSAGATVQYAEGLRDVLTVVSAGGGGAVAGGRVVFTLGQVAYREGAKRFTVEAAKVSAQLVGGALVSSALTASADRLNLPEEVRAAAGAGLGAFQLSKASKVVMARASSGVHPKVAAYRNQNPSTSTAGQVLKRPHDRDVLRRNLNAGGVPDPDPGATAAHHLVANDHRAAAARDVLDRVGIDINEASNGVFLPIAGKARIDGGLTVHNRMHTDKYYDILRDRITRAEAGGRAEVLNALSTLRQDLLHGRLSL